MLSLIRVLCCFGLVALPAIAAAQDFPSRPIKLIVPFPAGGSNDTIARVVGQRMSELFGQPVLIENRAGAGGVLGTDVVAKAEPDGYTIALTSLGALAISASVQEKMPYDATKDFKAITLVAKVPELLVVAASVPASTMSELIAVARAKPGQLNFASIGPGSLPHLAGELFKIGANVDIVHVPYRGGPLAVNDLLGQQVQMAFLDLPAVLPHVQAGKLKAIAVSSKVRVPVLKEIPTTAEAGFPQIEAENWYGIVAPAATPSAVVAKLNKTAVEALNDPDVREKLASHGTILVGDTPDEFAAYIRSEIEKWRKVAKAAGIKPNPN